MYDIYKQADFIKKLKNICIYFHILYISVILTINPLTIEKKIANENNAKIF